MFFEVPSNPSHSMISECSFTPRKSLSPCNLLSLGYESQSSHLLELADFSPSSIILSLQLITGSLPSLFISNDVSSTSWCSEGGKGKKDSEKENTDVPPSGGAAVVARIRCEDGSYWNMRHFIPFPTRFAAPRHRVRLLISSPPFQTLTVLIKN